LALGVGDAHDLLSIERHDPKPSRRVRAGLYSRAMRVLVCPDKFRGTLTARQAAEAIEQGWRRERPDDVVDLAPLADGGEGTLDVLVPPEAAGARRITRRVQGPLGDPVDAEFGIRDGTAVVEMARASGLDLLSPERRDPLRTTTYGTGELIAAALGEGASRLLVCLGGSATNDGGVGMATTLGGRFLGDDGAPIAPGGAALARLARIDLREAHARVRAVDVIGVTDVDNPLCGPAGASAVFGPQKGASPEDVVVLDRALAHLAAVAARDLAVDRSREPGAGAAGGLGFGLLAFLGARLRPGIEVVMDALDLRARISGADLVITGEGSFDEQSLRGKVADGVLRAAADAGVGATVLAGIAAVHPAGVRVRSLVEHVGRGAALGDARRSLEDLAATVAAEVAVGS
jgi:glycerate kinase